MAVPYCFFAGTIFFQCVPMLSTFYFMCKQDEMALYRVATSGDVSAVRRLVAANVNVDCTPFQVYNM